MFYLKLKRLVGKHVLPSAPHLWQSTRIIILLNLFFVVRLLPYIPWFFFCCATQPLNVNKCFENKSTGLRLSIKGQEMEISSHHYEHASKVVKELKSCSIPLWILFSLIFDIVLMPHKGARSQANILCPNTFLFWVTSIEGISFGCQKKICSFIFLKVSELHVNNLGA